MPCFSILSNFEVMGMLSKITKLRKNRRFEYNPRFYDDKGKGNPYKIEPKFDQFRSTLNTSRGLKRKINSAIEDAKRKGDRNLKMRMVIIIAVLVLIFLYIIDFDLSIFFSS
ncbi:MAG: riboflavin synthase subunit beta [Maribacter dokdonensis]|nr:riboflavin synthase subunit beta [Maribacter dokdonensis]|tara:strand:- start:1496 stop:1831 length:336 start_codon:yes stop_codon:yes gene_type:complete